MSTYSFVSLATSGLGCVSVTGEAGGIDLVATLPPGSIVSSGIAGDALRVVFARADVGVAGNRRLRVKILAAVMDDELVDVELLLT